MSSRDLKHFNLFAYLHFILSHVVLPFRELVDPVEDGVQWTNDQRCSELQVL